MLSVSATCGWCQVKVETSVAEPLPDGWTEVSVKSPGFGAGESDVPEIFCKEACADKYQEAAPGCHAKAAADYKTCFLQAMNVQRKERG